MFEQRGNGKRYHFKQLILKSYTISRLEIMEFTNVGNCRRPRYYGTGVTDNNCRPQICQQTVCYQPPPLMVQRTIYQPAVQIQERVIPCSGQTYKGRIVKQGNYVCSPRYECGPSRMVCGPIQTCPDLICEERRCCTPSQMICEPRSTTSCSPSQRIHKCCFMRPPRY
ncbi:hypothetical protein ACOME3_007873 [Neoechinorhynchus agilis]